MTNVTICPPNTDGPNFDKHQFLTQPRMATADSRIAHSDKERMHFKSISRQSWKNSPPEWAINDEILPTVILTYLERRFKRGGRSASFTPYDGSYEDRLARVRDFGTELIVPMQCKMQRLQNHRNDALKAGDTKRADNLAQHIQQVDTELVILMKGAHVVITAVVYLYYRVGYTSCDVASRLGIKPGHVRQIINRMNRTWRELMGGTRHKTKYSEGGVMHGRIIRPWTEKKLQRLFLMRAAGMTQNQCATLIKVSQSSVRFACKQYFKLTEARVRGKRVVMQRTFDGGRAIRYQCH